MLVNRSYSDSLQATTEIEDKTRDLIAENDKLLRERQKVMDMIKELESMSTQDKDTNMVTTTAVACIVIRDKTISNSGIYVF